MRKLVSVLLIAVMLMAVMSVSVFAENTDTQKEFLYKEKFAEYVGLSEYTPDMDEYSLYFYDYDELYYHKNDVTEEIDWALVTALTTMPPLPWEMVEIKQIGDRVIKWLSPGISAMPYGYAIYNASEDRFYDMEAVQPEQYEGLVEAFEQLNIGHTIGDVDMDGSLSVMDATEVQIYLAKVKDYPYGYYSYIPALADVMKDGNMDIMDATAIQLKIAGLDNKPAYNEEMVMVTYTHSTQPSVSKPEQTEMLSFEQEYSKQQLLHCVYKKNSIPENGDSFVIIKSSEQYNSLFNEKAPAFDDEFFKRKWLVASFVHTGSFEAIAPITAIYKADDTLYVSASPYIPDFNGTEHPLDPFWVTIISVDKAALASVTNIIPA